MHDVQRLRGADGVVVRTFGGERVEDIGDGDHARKLGDADDAIGGVIVATTEPTSLTDAYAAIKVLAAQQKRRNIKLVVNQTHRAGEGRVIRGQLQQVIDRFVSPADPASPVAAEAKVCEQ